MAEIEIVVEHEVGLHARPAAVFVKTATQFPCDIMVSKIRAGNDSTAVNAKSILSVLSLGVEQGDVIKIKTTGKEAQEALTALKTLIESNFAE